MTTPILQKNLRVKQGKAECLACCLALSKHSFPPGSALGASITFALKLGTGPEALVLSKLKIERLHVVSCCKGNTKSSEDLSDDDRKGVFPSLDFLLRNDSSLISKFPL